MKSHQCSVKEDVTIVGGWLCQRAQNVKRRQSIGTGASKKDERKDPY